MKFGKVKRRGYDKCDVQPETKTETSKLLTKTSDFGKMQVQIISTEESVFINAATT